MNEKIKKSTKKMMFAQIKANYNLTDAEVAFIDHEIELLERKNVSSNGDKKMTKEQVARSAIADSLWEMMELNMLYSVSQLQKMHPDMADYSNQKAYGVVKVLLDAKRVERIEDKRKVFFRKVC